MSDEKRATVEVRPGTPRGVCSVCGAVYRDGDEPATHGYCEECAEMVSGDVYEPTISYLASDYAGAFAEGDFERVKRSGRRFRFALRQFREGYESEIRRLRAEAEPLGLVVVGRNEGGAVAYVYADAEGVPWGESESEVRRRLYRWTHGEERLVWSIHPVTEGERT